MSSETTVWVGNNSLSDGFTNGTIFTKSNAAVSTLNLVFSLAMSNTYDTGILAYLVNCSSETTCCKIPLCNDRTPYDPTNKLPASIRSDPLPSNVVKRPLLHLCFLNGNFFLILNVVCTFCQYLDSVSP